MVGFLVGMLVFWINTKEKFENDVKDSIIALIGADIPFIILGAYLYNKIAFSNNFEEFVLLFGKDTGIAFLGGLCGGSIGYLLLFRFLIKNKATMAAVTDGIVPSIVISHFFGRIGCFLGGCCFGKVSKWGIVFDKNTPAYIQSHGQKVIPTQLIEALLLLILFIILVRVRNHQTLIYIWGYCSIRFVLEYFRGDERGNDFLLLTPSQFVSIVLMLMAGVVFLHKSGLTFSIINKRKE